MKMLRLIILILFINLSCSQEKNESNANSESDSPNIVILCKSDNAYAYHNSKCLGLSKCDAEIEEVTQEEAIKNGRKPCGFCY